MIKLPVNDLGDPDPLMPEDDVEVVTEDAAEWTTLKTKLCPPRPEAEAEAQAKRKRRRKRSGAGLEEEITEEILPNLPFKVYYNNVPFYLLSSQKNLVYFFPLRSPLMLTSSTAAPSTLTTLASGLNLFCVMD